MKRTFLEDDDISVYSTCMCWNNVVTILKVTGLLVFGIAFDLDCNLNIVEMFNLKWSEGAEEEKSTDYSIQVYCLA